MNANNDSQAWDDCPSGELQRLSERLRAQDRSRQRTAVAKTTTAVAAGVAMLVVGIGLVRGPAPMMCGECVASFDALKLDMDGQESLPASQFNRIQHHLSYCVMCQGKLNMEHPGMLEEVLAEERSRFSWAAHPAMPATACLASAF